MLSLGFPYVDILRHTICFGDVQDMEITNTRRGCAQRTRGMGRNRVGADKTLKLSTRSQGCCSESRSTREYTSRYSEQRASQPPGWVNVSAAGRLRLPQCLTYACIFPANKRGIAKNQIVLFCRQSSHRGSCFLANRPKIAFLRGHSLHVGLAYRICCTACVDLPDRPWFIALRCSHCSLVFVLAASSCTTVRTISKRDTQWLQDGTTRFEFERGCLSMKLRKETIVSGSKVVRHGAWPMANGGP